MRNKTVIFKVATYRRWSHTRSGRYETQLTVVELLVVVVKAMMVVLIGVLMVIVVVAVIVLVAVRVLKIILWYCW